MAIQSFPLSRAPARSAFNIGYYGSLQVLDWLTDCSTTVCACHRTYTSPSQDILQTSLQGKPFSEFDSFAVVRLQVAKQIKMTWFNWICAGSEMGTTAVTSGNILWQIWACSYTYIFLFCLCVCSGASLGPCAACTIFHIFFPLTTRVSTWHFDYNNPWRFWQRHGNSWLQRFAIGIIDNPVRGHGKSASVS